MNKNVLVISKFTMSPTAVERLKKLSPWYNDTTYTPIHPGFADYLKSVKVGNFDAVIINASSSDFGEELKRHFEELASWGTPVLRANKAPNEELTFFTYKHGRWQQCSPQRATKFVELPNIRGGVSVPRAPEEYVANPV